MEVDGMLTAFGKFCRKLRIEHDEILLDMAKKLGVTSAYLSAVEVGKRNVPVEWTDLISKYYYLDETERKELNDAIDASLNQIKINLDTYNIEKRQTAAMFARKLEYMDSSDIKKIMKIIKEV